MGVRFLGLGALGLAVCAAALSWAVWSAHASGYTRFNVGLLLLVPVALLGGSFIVGGVRELLKAKHFAGIAARESGRTRESSGPPSAADPDVAPDRRLST